MNEVKVVVGTRVVVHGMAQVAIVESVEREAESGVVMLNLNWPGFGKSRVRLHDKGSVWMPYLSVN